MDIAVYGLIGYEGALAIYEENRAFLDARFPAFWISDFLKIQEIQQNRMGSVACGQDAGVSIRKGCL